MERVRRLIYVPAMALLPGDWIDLEVEPLRVRSVRIRTRLVDVHCHDGTFLQLGRGATVRIASVVGRVGCEKLYEPGKGGPLV